MSRYRGPKLRIIRRLGDLPGLTTKRSKKENKPGKSGEAGEESSKKKSTEYGRRLEEKQKLKFIDTITNLTTNEKEVIIEKVFPVSNSLSKYYLITNIGILIAEGKNEKNYEITDLFLETTPGRLIFSINFINSIKLK